MRKYLLSVLVPFLTILLASAFVAASTQPTAPLEGDWLAVPLPVVAPNTHPVKNLSISSQGMVGGQPQYVVKIALDCGAQACPLGEFHASPFQSPLPLGLFQGPVFVLPALPAPSPRPVMVFGATTKCPAMPGTPGTPSILTIWTDGVSSYGQCFLPVAHGGPPPIPAIPLPPK